MAAGILTLCHGPPVYRRLAVALARSLALHAPTTPRAVVTDTPDAAELRAHFDMVIPLRPQYGERLVQKLHLHRYSPFERTLFLDADSLVVRSIGHVWRAFAGQRFGVLGFRAAWFDPSPLPVARRRAEYPVFNSGLVYFEDGGDVFADAASMLGHYAEWGIPYAGGHVNDEPLLAIAMATADLEPTRDDADHMMRSLVGIDGRLRLHARRGRSSFRKYGEPVAPAIVHFAGGEWRRLAYRREAVRLALTQVR